MKKVFSLLLALTMLLSLASAVAVAEEEPYVITMYNTLGGPKFGNDQLQHQWLLDNLNLDVQGEWPGGTDPAITLSTMAATGEMPDVIATGPSNRLLLQELIDAGMCQPLDDYLAQMPDYCSYVTDTVLDYFRDPNDGLLYMLPGFVVDPNSENYKNLLSDPHALGIRDDMFELTGITEIPKTFDEFYEFLKAAKEAAAASDDPLYDNFIPFAMDWSRFNIWAINYGASPTGWQVDEENGKMIPIYLQEGWRDAAVFFAKLYREGLIEPEELTMDFDDMVEKAKQASYGVFASHITQFNDYIKGALASAGYNFYYTAIQFPRLVPDSYTGWYHLNALGGSIAVFSKDIADMDKVIAYTNWQNTRVGNCITWWGAPDVEDSWFYLTDDGQDIVYNAQFMDAMAAGEKTTDYACPWAYWIAGPGVNDICQLYTNVIGSPGFDDFFGGMRECGYKDVHFDIAFDAFNIAKKGDIYNSMWTDITYTADAYLADIIMRTASDEEALAKYDEMVAEMEAIGVEDLETECYEVYLEANGK